MQSILRSLIAIGRVAVVLLVAVINDATAAASGLDDALCPTAGKRLNRSIGYRGDTVSAPPGAVASAARMNTLQTGAGEARSIAIMALALSGDLDAYRHLLQSADGDGLYIYASQYLNRDDTVCLDPEIERAIVDRLDHPILGRALVGFLGKNSYRDMATLKALLQVPFEATPARAYKYLATGQAITSTHLPGIEQDVMAHARALLPLDTPVKKNALPGLHRHYAKFFAGRGYVPAVAYLHEVLLSASRDEPVQNFQISFGMLRTVVQRALAEIGGVEAYALLIAELEDIAERPLDPFAASELQNLGSILVSPAQTSELRAIVAAYERLLRTPQPAGFDYGMRRTIYRALSELDAEHSAALLIAELRRYLGDQPPPNRDAAIGLIFSALTDMQNLDLSALFALVDNIASPSERRQVWRVAAAHPSETSVDFFLAELRLASSGGDAVEQQLGTGATETLLNLLVKQESPQLQHRARDGIDGLFQQGVLAERHYEDAVTHLNQALGDESAVYVAFRQQRAEREQAEHQARRQQAEEEGRRRFQAEYAEELARHSSADGIAGNVTSLAAHGSHARRAAEWLIIVGDAALPQLHEALAAAQTEDRHRVQIINVIGEIGSMSSTRPLIDAARARADGGLHRPVLFALALIPPREESIAFATAQLVAKLAERRRMAGLVYLAQIRHAPAAELVSEFSALERSPRLRAAGLYLGARLGLPGMAPAIETAMRQSSERSELDILLTGLAEAASDVDEFTRVARAS